MSTLDISSTAGGIGILLPVFVTEAFRSTIAEHPGGIRNVLRALIRELPIRAAVPLLLSDGTYGRIDYADLGIVSGSIWHHSHPPGGCHYVTRNPIKADPYREKILHRLLLNPPDEMDVDHINGNGLDNRRYNIRVCTHAQNMANSKRSSLSTSGVKGVSWESQTGKWRVILAVNKKRYSVGRYQTIEEATEARRVASLHYHGEFGDSGRPADGGTTEQFLFAIRGISSLRKVKAVVGPGDTPAPVITLMLPDEG